MSSAALHIKKLEDAGFINVQQIPGSKGSQKLCGVLISNVKIDMFKKESTDKHLLYSENVPIGNYLDFSAKPSCGIVTLDRSLDMDDSIYEFLSPERINAQLIWLSQGFLKYRFNNSFITLPNIDHINLSFEICSEALGYNNVWPSDITFSMNKTEVGIYHSEGDYGGRPGKYTPSWWSKDSTQFGLLVTITIDKKGTYINNNKTSDYNLSELISSENDFLDFKIEVKDDAEFAGGFNLFGERFGDYPQNIRIEVFGSNATD